MHKTLAAILSSLALAVGCTMTAAAQTAAPSNLPPGAQSAAEALIGTTFYACRGSVTRTDGKPLLYEDISPIEPLIVTNTSVSNPTRFSGARVYITLHPRIGPEVTTMAWVDADRLTPVSIRRGVRVDGALRTEPPNGGQNTPDVGTSESDMRCLLGPPETVNDFGHEQQMIYDKGRTIYSVDNHRHVVTSVTHYRAH